MATRAWTRSRRSSPARSTPIPPLGITAIPGTASLQLVGNTLGQPFTVQTTVNNQIPELDGSLFTGTNRYDFQLNAALLNGSLQLKKNSASDVVNALTTTDRNFLSTGIALTSVSYSGMMTGVVGNSISGAKQLSDQAKFDPRCAQHVDPALSVRYRRQPRRGDRQPAGAAERLCRLGAPADGGAGDVRHPQSRRCGRVRTCQSTASAPMRSISAT